MNINTKLMIIIGTAVVLGAGAVGLVTLRQSLEGSEEAVAGIEALGERQVERIRSSGSSRVEDFRRELLARKKEQLKAQVQTVLSAVERALKDARAMNAAGSLDERVKEAIELEQQSDTSLHSWETSATDRRTRTTSGSMTWSPGWSCILTSPS